MIPYLAMIGPASIPVVAVVSTFLFILLIILLTQSPKVGKWIVGATILVPLLTVAVKGLPHDGTVIPLIAILSTFSFVLLIIMLHHSRSMATGLIVIIISVVLLTALGVLPLASRHRQVYEQTIVGSAGRINIRQQTQSNDGIAIVDRNVGRVYEGVVQVPSPPVLPSPPVPAASSAGDELSPIWSEGVENEYEADIYPSKLAAVRALGTRLREWTQNLVKDANGALDVVLFQEENDRSLMWELERAMEQESPKIRCAIEAGTRNLAQDEIGITLRFTDARFEPAPWARDHGPLPLNGQMQAQVRNRDREMTVMSQSFVEKPWVADFASFSSQRPKDHFLIARSQGACTSENEAKRQAEDAARVQLLQRLDPLPPAVPGQSPAVIAPSELLEGGFVVDQFVQSFDGLSGRLWRQAILIDAAPEKLARLSNRLGARMHVERVTWARMILSGLGVLVVIIATYLFLNMATRGYYVWSLRIAGAVLAVAGIVSIILIL